MEIQASSNNKLGYSGYYSVSLSCLQPYYNPIPRGIPDELTVPGCQADTGYILGRWVSAFHRLSHAVGVEALILLASITIFSDKLPRSTHLNLSM